MRPTGTGEREVRRGAARRETPYLRPTRCSRRSDRPTHRRAALRASVSSDRRAQDFGNVSGQLAGRTRAGWTSSSGAAVVAHLLHCPRSRESKVAGTILTTGKTAGAQESCGRGPIAPEGSEEYEVRARATNRLLLPCLLVAGGLASDLRRPEN